MSICPVCNTPKLVLFTTVECGCGRPTTWRIGQPIATREETVKALKAGCTVRMVGYGSDLKYKVREGVLFHWAKTTWAKTSVNWEEYPWNLNPPWVFTVDAIP